MIIGSTTTPSGLAKITARVNSPDTDNTATFVYGGDLQGNLWRVNMSGSTMAVSTMATLYDGSGLAQSITTRPEVGQINNVPIVFVGTGRLLGVTDLQNPNTLTPPGNWSYVGSIYGLWERRGWPGLSRRRSGALPADV